MRFTNKIINYIKETDTKYYFFFKYLLTLRYILNIINIFLCWKINYWKNFNYLEY